MLRIRRTRFFQPSYEVSDDEGRMATWTSSFWREGAAGDVEGVTYVFRKDGRKRFVLATGEDEVAVAEQAKRRSWTVSAAGAEYELRPAKGMRQRMELSGPDGTLGTLHRERRTLVCDLPAELSFPAQTFIGLVTQTLWNRQAAAVGGATAASGAAASGA